MPWTFAHPAAILPLRHLPLLSRQPQALALGAIAPDAARHLGMPHLGPWMHDWHVMLTWHWWVVALLALALGQAARGLTAWWPAPLRRWALRVLGAPALPGWRHRLLDACSCALGALAGVATHLAWDSLTHAWGWPVRHWPALSQELPGLGVPVYSGLQLGFSVLGVLCLVRVLRRGLERESRREAGPHHDAERAEGLAQGQAVAQAPSTHGQPPALRLALAMGGLGLLLAAGIWWWLPESGSGGDSDWAGRILMSLADGMALAWVGVSWVHGRMAPRAARPKG